MSFERLQSAFSELAVSPNDGTYGVHDQINEQNEQDPKNDIIDTHKLSLEKKIMGRRRAYIDALTKNRFVAMHAINMRAWLGRDQHEQDQSAQDVISLHQEYIDARAQRNEAFIGDHHDAEKIWHGKAEEACLLMNEHTDAKARYYRIADKLAMISQWGQQVQVQKIFDADLEKAQATRHDIGAILRQMPAITTHTHVRRSIGTTLHDMAQMSKKHGLKIEMIDDHAKANVQRMFSMNEEQYQFFNAIPAEMYYEELRTVPEGSRSSLDKTFIMIAGTGRDLAGKTVMEVLQTGHDLSLFTQVDDVPIVKESTQEHREDPAQMTEIEHMRMLSKDGAFIATVREAVLGVCGADIRNIGGMRLAFARKTFSGVEDLLLRVEQYLGVDALPKNDPTVAAFFMRTIARAMREEKLADVFPSMDFTI